MIPSRQKLPERVTQYKKLESWLHEEWDNDKEIQCRIEAARNYFIK